MGQLLVMRRYGLLRLGLVMLALLSWPARSWATFEAACVTHLQAGQAQTNVWIELAPHRVLFQQTASACRARLAVTLEFRKPRGVLVYQSRFRKTIRYQAADCQPDQMEPLRFHKRVQLRPGEYNVTVALRDLNRQQSLQHSFDYTLKLAAGPFRMGDAIIQVPGRPDAPQINPQIPAYQASLPFAVAVASDRPAAATLRAILYRKTEESPTAIAHPYQSVLQVTKGLNFRSGTNRFASRFNLEGLQSGDYLLEVYLFRDNAILAERSQAFHYNWQGLERVLTQLDTAIRQLKYRASAKQIQRLLAIEDEPAQRRAFLDFWRRRATVERPSPLNAIEQYYKQIAHANEAYASEAHPGWQTDRGAVFMRYGPPDRTRTFQRGGQRYRAWYYSRYNLRVVYRRRGQRFDRVVFEAPPS